MFSLDKLHEELIRDEKERLESYKDSQGFWTIGVGHLLGTVQRMLWITPSESAALLNSDIEAALAIARLCIPKFDTLDDTRQRALINMAFNRGHNMKFSTTITPAINLAISNGDWKSVIVAIASSQWRTQVGVRADRIGKMLERGDAT